MWKATILGLRQKLEGHQRQGLPPHVTLRPT